MNNTVKEYMEAHDLQTRDATDVIEEFSDELAKMTGKCIDIGCGPASVTRKLLMPRMPPNVHIVGGDISKKMVEFAKQTHSDEERLSFIELDVEVEKIPKDLICAFDNVVSFYCLHWCQDTRKAFENIYQILRPGGRGLVLFLAYNDGFDSYLRIAEVPQYKSYMTDVEKYVPYFQHCDNPRAKMKKMLEEVGFKVLHCSLREKTFVYKSLEILKKHVVAVNPFINRMPEDIGEKFEKDLLREIVSGKISFANKNNGSKEEEKVLDRYYVLIAHFEKPDIGK
ncbi:juvenile hormone acid O-methyltransferase-like [Copidosoma floridanum]|uniref:juvenile hormone acid O-methyltransferase-like n=1 Tax=Copidosoma floridanum TaxID=29053 RepID=UPI0006C93CB2|nr:juvenile hormone acid O-methyltransferase-like [Copidosoma floridanum]